jgi:hypothetical protein
MLEVSIFHMLHKNMAGLDFSFTMVLVLTAASFAEPYHHHQRHHHAVVVTR